MERYARQTALKEIGTAGQKRLASAVVTVIGCGGLGCIAAPYLAAAGVGQLVLVDGDRIDKSNLHRQVFYSDSDIGKNKARNLSERIKRLNPEIQVEWVDEMLTKEKAQDVLANSTLVVECTDHIQTKYLVNDFCHHLRIPLIYGAIHQFVGYVSLFENNSGDGIHLRDAFPEMNEEIPSCSEVGVLGTVAGTIGLLQANEALKFLLGLENPLAGRLLQYDFLANEQYTIRLKKTYTKLIVEQIQESTYLSEVCEVPEISTEELLTNRHQYQLISILPQNEHENIDDDVLHQPLQTINPTLWSDFSSNLIPVLYCKSGKRSSKLVQKIIAHRPDLQIYSLSGGINAFNLAIE